MGREDLLGREIISRLKGDGGDEGVRKQVGGSEDTCEGREGLETLMVGENTRRREVKTRGKNCRQEEGSEDAGRVQVRTTVM